MGKWQKDRRVSGTHDKSITNDLYAIKFSLPPPFPMDYYYIVSLIYMYPNQHPLQRFLLLSTLTWDILSRHDDDKGMLKMKWRPWIMECSTAHQEKGKCWRRVACWNPFAHSEITQWDLQQRRGRNQIRFRWWVICLSCWLSWSFSAGWWCIFCQGYL